MLGSDFMCDAKHTTTRGGKLRHYEIISNRSSEGYERTHVDVVVKERMPQFGQPRSRAILADIRMCTPTS
jgi:hypothetical protein